MGSVRAKSERAHLSWLLSQEYGRSRIEAEVLSERSMEWLLDLGVRQRPGQMRLTVPATAARRYARSRRKEVMVTVSTAVEKWTDSAA